MGRKDRRRLRKLADELAYVHPHVADPDGLIREGAVLVDGRIVRNAGSLVRVGASIALDSPSPLRGEVKLRAALQAFDLTVEGRIALDIGAAAGGFTRVLLEAGASRVYAVDAGYGQLLGSLRRDPRVINLERTNLGELDTVHVPDVIDVITMDLSYLPVAKATEQLEVLRIAPDADLVALVKPMFELGLAAPPSSRGELRLAAERARDGLKGAGWQAVGVLESPVTGSRGTTEYFIHGRRAGVP